MGQSTSSEPSLYGPRVARHRFSFTPQQLPGAVATPKQPGEGGRSQENKETSGTDVATTPEC